MIDHYFLKYIPPEPFFEEKVGGCHPYQYHKWIKGGKRTGGPQGGPLSPLLSNIMLDVLDKELEKRGHCFVRHADDCNILRQDKESRRTRKRIHYQIHRKKMKIQPRKVLWTAHEGESFLDFALLTISCKR